MMSAFTDHSTQSLVHKATATKEEGSDNKDSNLYNEDLCGLIQRRKGKSVQIYNSSRVET